MRKKLQMPVMLVWGDGDMFRPEHMIEFDQLGREAVAKLPLAVVDILRYLSDMSKRPAPEPEGALYVKLPAQSLDKLDRAAEALGVRKKDLVAGLVTRYVDPDSRQGLHALGALANPRRVTLDLPDGGPTLGSYSFQAYDAAPPSEVMTVAQAAELLQVDEKTVLQLAEAGDMPARKLGSTWRFSRRAVLDWLAAGER